METKHPYNTFKKTFMAVSLAVLLTLLTGCNLPIMPAATPTLQPSSTALPLLDTATPLPATATAAPTVTPTASPTATPSAVNIVFTAGTTAAVEQGTIQPNQVKAYSLSAGQNQPMILLVSSTNNDVYLGVTEPDGTKLLDPAKKYANWQWLLPKTELYTIQVYGGATGEDYTLTTKVAQLVNFPAGASSVTLSGSTPKGYVVSYSLACAANQVMTVSLKDPVAYLDVFGLATGPLLSASAKAISWSGTLPTTQAYIIEVIPVNGQVVNYTLTVTVK
jgi:hypothetical protein